MPARAYGPAAAEYAQHLGDLPAYVVGDDLKPAWNEMLHARSRGTNFAAMFLLDEPRVSVAALAAEAICAQVASYDERRFLMEQIENGDLDLEGQSILQRSVHDPEHLSLLRDVVRLPGTVIVRSFAELQRLRQACSRIRNNVACWFPTRDLGEWSPARRGDTIVIWAPSCTSGAAALAAFALDQAHADVVLVSRGPAPSWTRFSHMEPAAPGLGALLARASCIVDVAHDDPSWAYAFAARGVPVAAASTGGADEVVDGLAIYDPWSFRSIAGAVAEALGRGPGTVRRGPPGLETIERSLALGVVAAPEREPLVSIVIPTLNRREILERSLRDLIAQTYRNLDIVVVNDGGEPLTGLSFDPRIRIIDLPVNTGGVAAANAGIAAAWGEYVAINPDDDALYLDHVMRLVAALERTSSGAAHSDTLIRREVVDENGAASTVYYTDRFSTTLDRAESYVFHRIAGNSLLVRRSVYDTIGTWDEQLFLADVEFQIRLGERYDVVHVPSMTAEWWDRGKDQLSSNPAKHAFDEFTALCERHPAPGRPYIAALRTDMFQRLA